MSAWGRVPDYLVLLTVADSLKLTQSQVIALQKRRENQAHQQPLVSPEALIAESQSRDPAS